MENCDNCLGELGETITIDDSALAFCEDCSPTYADLLNDCESYYGSLDQDFNPIFFTPETYKVFYDDYINSGGKPTDIFNATSL